MRPKSLRLGMFRIPVSYHRSCITSDDDSTIIAVDDGDPDGAFGLAFSVRSYRLAISEQASDIPTTLLHEAFHVALRMHGGNRLLGDDTEECIVQMLADATVELLRRNKGLAAYLSEGR